MSKQREASHLSSPSCIFAGLTQVAANMWVRKTRLEMPETNEHSQVLTLKQAAAYLRISKAHLSNVINGKVSGAPPFRHAQVGRRILIKREWADEFLKKAGQKSAPVDGSICQEPMPSTQERGKQMRRKRFQKGSLQARKHGRHRVWVGCYWDGGCRRSKVLGRCSQMGKGEAESILSAMLQPINSAAAQGPKPVYTFEQFTDGVYLPFCRRSWKESTAGTSEQIVKTHLVREFGKQLLRAIRRDQLQVFSTGARWSWVPAW